jgi:hypothetical protein
MADNGYVGNAAIDSKDHRGWIIGHFLDREDGIRVGFHCSTELGIAALNRHAVQDTAVAAQRS